MNLESPLSAYLECPVCDWTHERETVKYANQNHAAAPAVAEAMGMPPQALLAIHAQQAARRDENALESHLRSHGPHQWVPALMEAKNRVNELEREVTRLKDILLQRNDDA